MFTGEIDAYILSHIDEEGDLLSALNRDAKCEPSPSAYAIRAFAG